MIVEAEGWEAPGVKAAKAGQASCDGLEEDPGKDGRLVPVPSPYAETETPNPITASGKTPTPHMQDEHCFFNTLFLGTFPQRKHVTPF